MSTRKTSRSDEPAASYDAAMKELEGIIAKVENPSVAIDELAPLVERGTALVNYCRQVLLRTQQRVEVALEALDAEVATGQTAPAADDEDDDVDL